MPGRQGVRRPQDAPRRSRRPSAAPASRHRDHPPAPPHAAVGRRLVGIDVRVKSPAAASGASAASPTRSTNVPGPTTTTGRYRSPQATGPLPACRGAQPHPVAGPRQHRLGGTGGDRGRDDDIAASAQPDEAGSVAAMPTNQLRTSFVPMTSTRRSPSAGSIQLRTLNAYAFRVVSVRAVGAVGEERPRETPNLSAQSAPCGHADQPIARI